MWSTKYHMHHILLLDLCLYDPWGSMCSKIPFFFFFPFFVFRVLFFPGSCFLFFTFSCFSLLFAATRDFYSLTDKSTGFQSLSQQYPGGGENQASLLKCLLSWPNTQKRHLRHGMIFNTASRRALVYYTMSLWPVNDSSSADFLTMWL